MIEALFKQRGSVMNNVQTISIMSAIYIVCINSIYMSYIGLFEKKKALHLHFRLWYLCKHGKIHKSIVFPNLSKYEINFLVSYIEYYYYYHLSQGRSQPHRPGWARVPPSSFFLKSRSIFLIFPQTSLIFFLILALRVGESPTQESSGYVTDLSLLPLCHTNTKCNVDPSSLCNLMRTNYRTRLFYDIVQV